MAMFGLSPRGQYESALNLLERPADMDLLEREQRPGAFEGNALDALGTGIYRGLSRGASAAANVATPALRGIAQTPMVRALDAIFGTDTDAYLVSEQEKANRALFGSKIDPKTNGAAAQILYGLGDVLTTVVSTGGNPYAAGGLYGITQTAIGMDEGLDRNTALMKGAIEGLAMGVSVALPAAMSGGLAFRMASGGLLNVGVGIPERATVGALLNARGYPEMAQQYQAFDATSIITELALGAAFGGVLGPRARAKLPPPEAIPPSAVDAALSANQATHAEIHTAPGIPTTTATRQSHVDALNTAVDQLVMGREVNVENLLREAGFIGKRPDFDALRVITEELKKAGADDMVAKVRAIEDEARSRGLYIEPDTLGTVVLSDKPVTSRVGGVEGGESQVRIGDDYVPTRLVLMDASDVAATMTKADNQFRDRTRLASEQQIQDIAARLDERLLMDAPVMDYGAPVLAADGTVIGGNGRAAAVNLAYERGTAAAYKEALRAMFGDAVDGMQRPMLVRVLQRDVDIQKAAILSNEGQALRMSALEQAKVDAERLGDFRDFQFGEDGALDMVANMPFIRGWVEQMPPGQRAAIMDADGRLSAEGLARLRNAILYRAYGDSPTLARLVEATDPGSRNIAAALTRAAPAVADAREAIARGDLYPMGLHDDLIAAVEKYEALRSQGMSVDTWSKQIDAFGDGMTPEARLLVQFMDANLRSSRAISEGIFGFYNRLLEAGNPKQGSMFEAAQPDKMRMLTLALEEPAPMYGRGDGKRSTVADLTTTFRAMFGKDAERLLETGRVKIVQSVKDLPGSDHPADVGGMYWKGEAWVVADNTGLSQIRGRVLHEIGEHAGMQQMLGDALYQQVLDTIERKVVTDPVFKEARALAEARANRPEHVPAETLAYLVENAPELPVVRRVLAAVRQWLYRATGGRFVDLTQADLQQMAAASLRRYAREAEVAMRGEDAPWYMTLFHGSPTPFKPEPGAPLGRLRWKYINTGEGAQAFGYGHYVAQQEWIARTRYRDRLVQRKAKDARLELPYPGDPDATFVIDDSTGPGYRFGGSIVHPNMDGELGGIGWAIRELGSTKGDVDQVRAWAEADLADDRVKLEAYRRGNMNAGTLQRVQRQIEYWEAALRVLDDLTVEGPVQWLVKFEEDYNGKIAEQVSEFNTRADAENYLARVLNGQGRVEEVMGRVLRPDITEVKPEPPKGALYGKFIPDEQWNQMMIWDAPLSAQPENVRAAFEKLGIKDNPDPVVDANWGEIGLAPMTGNEAYLRLISMVRNEDAASPEMPSLINKAMDELAARRTFDWEGGDIPSNFNPEEIASIMLYQAGIPGHRFLDGETRAAGWDSPDAKFNVVLYSDDLGRVAWEAKGKAGEKPTEWVTANGRAKIVLTDDGANGRYGVEIDGKEIDYELSLEPAMRIAEQALEGQLYSRTGSNDKIAAPDPVEETTMPDARRLTEQADAESATATELSQGFLPAVECFLRVGE